jgi:hypothetical protein
VYEDPEAKIKMASVQFKGTEKVETHPAYHLEKKDETVEVGELSQLRY